MAERGMQQEVRQQEDQNQALPAAQQDSGPQPAPTAKRDLKPRPKRSRGRRLSRETRGWGQNEIQELRLLSRRSLARLQPRQGLRFLRRNLASILFYTFIICILTFVSYFRLLPERYAVTVGELSPADIISPRALEDEEATKNRAREAMRKVNIITDRSEQISTQSVESLRQLFKLATEQRQDLRSKAEQVLKLGGTSAPTGSDKATEASQAAETKATEASQAAETVVYTAEQIQEAAQQLQTQVQERLGRELTADQAKLLISFHESFFRDFQTQCLSLGETIMANTLDLSGLEAEIDRRCTELVESRTVYKSEYGVSKDLLRLFLQANVVNDEAATQQAREAEYNRVMDDPTWIPAGTRIVSRGELVTEAIYKQLRRLNLIEYAGVDFSLLLPLLLLAASLSLLTALYLKRRRHEAMKNVRERLFVTLVSLLCFISSAYALKISPFASTLYALAIIITLNYDLETGLILSTVSALMLLPFYSGDMSIYFILFLALPVICFLAHEQKKSRSMVKLLLCSGLVPALAVLLLSYVQKIRFGVSIQNAFIAGVSGGLSAILASGLQPLLDLLTTSVSAAQLIRLAEPSQPLLRRLFLEAPGTYQHSMMVANLAENGAEAVGADALLVRVGSYYHDIGKMLHPEAFTENQTTYNPHDYMSPTESVSVIIGHVTEGVKLARRYRLPERIQDFILEHHGNTLQAYFYYKACEEAEQKGLAAPEEASFRYPGPIPQSKETAIVMLADSLEAAMRSIGIKELEGMKKLAEKILRIKTEQNQLVDSGLTYKEVRQVLEAFAKVYEGQFHHRVKYPEPKEDDPLRGLLAQQQAAQQSEVLPEREAVKEAQVQSDAQSERQAETQSEKQEERSEAKKGGEARAANTVD